MTMATGAPAASSPRAWRALRPFAAHAKPISSVRFSRDGRLLASSSADTSVKIWAAEQDAAAAATTTGGGQDDGEQGEGTAPTPLATLVGHEEGVSGCDWSPDARLLVSASDDKTARLWDVEVARCVATLGATSRALLGGDQPPGVAAALLATASGTGRAAVSSVSNTRPAADTDGAGAERETHADFVFCAAFNPQGSLVATGSYDETVRLWDVRTAHCVALLSAHQEPVTSAEFSADGSLLVTGGFDGLVRVWDIASRQCLRTLVAEPAAPVGSAAFAPNSRYVLSGTLDGRLRLWDVLRARCVRTFTGHANRKFCLATACLDQDGARQLVLSGSEDHAVYMWDVDSGEQVDKLAAGLDAPVLAVDAHPSGTTITAGANTKIATWRRAPVV